MGGVRRRTPPPGDPHEKKKTKGLELLTTPLYEETEPDPSSVLNGEEILALAIRPEDLEKLHAPRPPTEEHKVPVSSRILVRKYREHEEGRKRCLLVARPAPPGAVARGLDYSGTEGLLCDAHGQILPHSILGTLQDLKQEAAARGNLQVAQLIPDPPPPYTDTSESGWKRALLEQTEVSWGRPKQDQALDNWQHHMALRRRQLDTLSRRLRKPPGQLLMNVCEDFRGVQEERHLIDRSIPAVEHGKGQRVGSEFWNLAEHIGDELSGLTMTLTQCERGYAQPFTRIGKPRSIQQETGPTDRPPFHLTWDKSLYLQQRRHELRAVMEELNFTKPDIDGLEVIGRGKPFTLVSAEQFPLYEEDRDFTAEEKDNPDPLEEYPGVVPAFVLGPSLLFCKQPAYWVESSVSHRDKVGISTRITFEAVAGEKASSVLEVVNNGSAAVWYDWRRLPHVGSLGGQRTEPRVQRFYFNTSAGVILPTETQTFPFHFKSVNAGIFSESWEFCSHPVLLAGASLEVSLWGIAVYEDKTAQLREDLQRELDSREARVIAEQMVQVLLDRVRSPERPRSPATRLTEEELFHLENPKLHYKHKLVKELRQLWTDNIPRPAPETPNPTSEPSGTEPRAEEARAGWNLSVTDLEQAALSLPEDEPRESLLSQLNRNIMDLSVPPQEASLGFLHQACLQLWREAVDEIVRRSLALGHVLGMPDKDVSMEFAVEEAATDQKRLKAGKEEKRVGGMREDKRIPTGKEKEEKKGGKTASREKVDKEDRSGSRKGKRKEEKKFVKNPSLLRESSELSSSGESGVFSPADGRPFQVDPIVQEKYQENLYTEVYGVLRSLVQNLVSVAEGLKPKSVGIEEETEDCAQ